MIQKTLVLLKPDAVERMLMGRIIQRFEDAGLKTIGMKMIWVDQEFGKKHYFDLGERHGERVLKSMVEYLMSGPIVAICLEGINAVEVVRKIVGSTYPNEAPPGTIRGDFGHISKDYANAQNKRVSNLIHASGNSKDAEYEIPLWFTAKELHDYKTVHDLHVR
ncbi:MAG: nucleoside-diphosphate kinase [archaeon]